MNHLKKQILYFEIDTSGQNQTIEMKVYNLH